MLKSVHQALGVPMSRMSYHVVDSWYRALVRSSDRRDRSTPSRAPSGENPFHLMPWWQVLSKDPMRSASKRALISSNLCLCSGVNSSYVTGSPFDIPMAEVDVVDVEGSHRACQNVLSAKTHRRVLTGNTRAKRPGASIHRPCSSHAP
jgi:hypothetical protein